jgi:hypothetical protein
VSWVPPDALSYAYLLGAYLGDGYISPKGQLVIACDRRYPEIIEECCGAIILTSLRNHVGVCPHRDTQCVRVTCSWQGWFEAFPQHGLGRKHDRRIALEAWQQAVVDRFPWHFLRGLLHSDGCRTVNRFKTKLPSGPVREYEYPRWFFSNLSADIPVGCSARRRPGRGGLDAVQPPQHLDLAPAQRRAARRARRAEGVTLRCAGARAWWNWQTRRL